MANITKIPREISNSEIEKSEFVIMPNMMTFVAKGSNHNTDITKKGGIPTILPEGARIFSHKLKAEKDLVNNLVGKDKIMSYADMAKMFDTMPELKDLIDPKSDDLSKKTSQLMLTKKIAQLDGIFNAQETVKQDTSTKSLNDILSGVIPKGNGAEQALNETVPQFQSGGYFDPIRPTVPKSNQYNPLKKVDETLLSPNNQGFNYLGKNVVNRQEQLFPETSMVKDNLFGQTLYNDPRVGEYQMKAIGYDKDKGYLTDLLSTQVRRETVKHIFDDYASPNWKHIDVFDSKGNPIIKSGKRLVDNLPEGDFKFSDRKNALGQTLPSYIDNDNVRYQSPMYRNITEEQILGNPTTSTPTPLTTILTNPDGTPINLPNNPNPINNIPTNPKTNVPLQSKDPIKDTYLMSMFRDLGDLGGLEIRPPEYNYKPQQIAYQRFLPQTPMYAERQFNIQKQNIENSNLPEQVKQSMLADLSGKLQDNISEVQMRNVQGDNQNDNNNVNLFNQVTDSNRREKIGYDDKYNELQDRTLFNYGQEKLRLQDQLLSTYGKYGQNQLMKNLVNSMGVNFVFDGQSIQYVPNRGIKDNTNPLQQYGNEDAIQKLIKQLNSTSDPKAMKDIAEAIKALQG